MDGGLAKTIAFGIEAGEIIARRIAADRREGRPKGLIQAIGFWDESHVDGSIDAMYTGVAAVGIVLRQPKVGQHLLPAPPQVAGGRPIVVVLRVAAVIGHAVDGA